MRYALALLPILALAGCSSSATMAPQAEPHASSALDTIDGLEEYLTASGVEVLSARQLPTPPRPGVVRAASFRFDAGGRCTILTYPSAQDAEEYAPKTVTRENREYSRGGFAGYGASARRDIEVPTILFGANAALCQSEAPEVTQALEALGAYAEAVPVMAPADA
jgi:hypothetical protein